MQANDDARPCLDPETLAAWVDGGLSPAERTAAEAHASTCERCQAMLAAFVRAEPPPSRPVRWRSSGVIPWMVPLTAAVAALALLFAVDPAILRSPAAPPRALAPQPTPPPTLAPAKERADVAGSRDENRQTASRPIPAAPVLLDKKAAGARPQSGSPENEARNEPKVVAAQPPPAVAQAGSATAADRLSERMADIVSPTSDTRWRILSPDRVERSADGGTTWTPTQLPPGVQVTAGASPAAGVCWLVGPKGLVLRTTDGSTWTAMPFPQPLTLVGVRATGAEAAVVTSDAGASFETSDGGRTWVRR